MADFIGSMNKRITFCKFKEVKNELEQIKQIIVPVKTVWASVDDRIGREFIEGEKEHPELTYIVKTRYFNGITPDMFIQFRGRLLNIKAALNVREENKVLEITCTEKLDEKKKVEKNG